MNGLNGEGHSSQDPKFLSTKRELLILKVAHFQSQVLDQIVVNEGRTGCWDVWRSQTTEGSSTAREDVLDLLIGISVAQSLVIKSFNSNHFGY